jgi:L-rhamnose mutarotase
LTRVALHTRVRSDKVDEYEAAHREVPAELVAAIKSAGVSEWTIWRSGVELFHVIDCDDYAGLLAALENLPVNIAWQERMAGYLDVVHDYSAGGAESTLPIVWQL